MSIELVAKQFLRRLKTHTSPTGAVAYRRHFQAHAGGYGEGDRFGGASMGKVFSLAKEFSAMPLLEIETLLESPIHEAHVGAVSIMDFQARSSKTVAERRRGLSQG